MIVIESPSSFTAYGEYSVAVDIPKDVYLVLADGKIYPTHTIPKNYMQAFVLGMNRQALKQGQTVRVSRLGRGRNERTQD